MQLAAQELEEICRRQGDESMIFGRRETVFISYSSMNDRFVREVILPQVKRAKRDHWFAPEDIRSGDHWRDELEGNLVTCDRLLVVVSKEAQNSNWVKGEVSHVAKSLLEQKVKLDPGHLHRAILPVSIDERDEFGGRIGSADQHEKPEYLYEIHPYLTMVKFISIPDNEILNQKLDPKTGKYLKADAGLTKEQLASIQKYAKERKQARKNLTTLIRNPDVLSRRKSRFGRPLAFLLKTAFQACVLAAGLLAALFLLTQLPGSVLDSNLSRIFNPVIKIEIQPLEAEVNTVRSTSLTKDLTNRLVRPQTTNAPDATRYVRFQLDDNATPQQNLGSPGIEMKEISSAEAQEALAAGNVVRRIRVTVAGKTTESYVQLMAKTALAVNPQIEITIKNNEAEVKDAVKPEAGKPTELFIEAKTEDGATLVTRKVTVESPLIDPPEFEVLIDGQSANLGMEASTPLGIHPSEKPVSVVVRLKDSPGTERYAELQPPPKTAPAEFEVLIDGQPANLGAETSTPLRIPPSEKPTSVIVRLKDSPGTERYAELQPLPKTAPAEFEVLIDGQPANLGTETSTPLRIPPSEKPTSVIVRLKDIPGTERYAELQPLPKTAPAEFEVLIDSQPANLGVEALKPLRIPASEKPMSVVVRLKDSPGTERYAELQPLQRTPPEIAFFLKDGSQTTKQVTLEHDMSKATIIPVSKDSTLIAIRLQNFLGAPTYYAKLQPPMQPESLPPGARN